MSEQKTADERDTSTTENETCQTSAPEKKVYEKPQLRKYTQIDYVTAYGVD
jgi:hypothetical protein